MSTKTEVTSNGIGSTGALAILFIALKLLGVIDWAWIWVLSPLWIGVAFFLFIFLIFVVLFIIAAIFGKVTVRK